MARGRKSTQKEIKRANGSGCIRKLSGNRRKPFQVLITTGMEYNEDTGRTKQIVKQLGTYETRELADQALTEYNLNPYDMQTDKITFKDVYNEWSKRYYPELKNKSSERSNIAAFNYSKPLHNQIFKSITIVNMRDTINNADVGDPTKGRMKSLYNLMYDYAVEAQICPVNLARQFNVKGLQKKIEKQRKDKIPFSEKDEAKLWENIDYGFTRMVLIGIYSGFRPIELCLLKVDDINLEKRYMIGGVKTEAGENRYVPIHDKIYELVEYCYNLAVKNNSKTLFYDERSSLTYDKYIGRFKKVLKYNILDGYSPHCTRHTFITKAKRYEMNEYALKMIAGHEIDDITEKVYTHRDKTFLHNEMKKIL